MTKQQIIKYLKENEFNIQNANASFLAADIIFKAYANSKIRGVNFSPMFSFFNYSNPNPFYQIIKEEYIRRITKKIYLDYLKNQKSLNVKIKKHQELTLKLDKIWQEYKIIRKKEVTDKILAKTFKNFVEIMERWWYYGAILEDKCEVINLEIVPKFQKRHNLTEKKALEIISILSHPKEQAVFNLERKDFLKICLTIVNNKKLKTDLLKSNYKIVFQNEKVIKLLDNYIKKYFWFKTDFYKATVITPEILIEDVYQKIIKHDKTKIKTEIKNINDNFKKIHNQKIKILKQIKLSNKDSYDINFAQKIIYWFDQRKLGTMKHFYYFLNIVTDIAKRFDIDYHELSLHTLDELHELLATGKKLSKKESSKRNNKMFIVYEKSKKTKLFYGSNAQKMLGIVTHIKDKEIKGVVASAGKEKKFIGIVRIVNNPTKDKFNNQDILVTSMTRIEFVPLMRKAKAIITNEGGIGCHAAIVSRELGIPCIIGTKIATQILKDGDLVEVDADKGVVKILKGQK